MKLTLIALLAGAAVYTAGMFYGSRLIAPVTPPLPVPPSSVVQTVRLMDLGADPSREGLAELSEWMEANPDAWNAWSKNN